MRTLSLMLGLLLVNSAAAFEVDVFQSGMTREQVRQALASYAFERVQDFSATTLIAYDTPERASHRQFVFDFCNDRLVGLQQEVAPSLRNLVIVINNYNGRYGQPVRVIANTNVTSIGERNELAVHWRKGPDMIGVRYVTTPPVESLMLVYESPNNCWQVPR
ncbi:hypothetical protein [Thiobacter aerophilum]|uniref:DUF2066 domain-containing protein n=1 Tax=Thiobacter aerophilum TaxID=3121275 RepID=A0ABV0EJD7_9BURK